MPPTKKPLSHLTSKYLQHTSHLCGLPNTGTKKTLLTTLRAAAALPAALTPTSRILSIDLGIRNLAFALLVPRRTTTTLEAWKRLDLLPPASASALAHDFSPPSTAHIALSLLRTHLLPLAPTHVLIERQRYRSGGAAAVLEWTLRVNALETALHAALATMRHLDVWRGRVVSVPPRRATNFMVGVGGEGEGVRLLVADEGRGRSLMGAALAGELTAARRKKAMKLAKVRLVEASLKEGKAVALGTDEAREAARRFLAAGEPKRRRKKGDPVVDKGEDDRKRDDLADCLCQGVAWLQWQRNMEDLKVKEKEWLLAPGEEAQVQDAEEFWNLGGQGLPGAEDVLK
ncbi:mitochondrial resolvase Ydc2 [Podospora conica]|nr:mitochondrial resolvase Ydc2 [Schizothecium conicum]